MAEKQNDKQKLPSFEAIEQEIANILEIYDSPENDLGEYSLELNDEQKNELEAYLNELFQQEQQKVDGFCQWLRMDEDEEARLRKEANILLQRARSKERTRNFLKMRYLQIMDEHGVKKVSGSVYNLSRRVTKVAHIIDEKLVPDEWCNIETIRKPDKRDILVALKRGETVQGCELGESVSLQARTI